MADLVEGTYATGKGVVRPGRNCTPSVASSDDSDDDFSKDSPLNPILCSSQTSVTPISAVANALAASSGSVALATLSGVFPTPGKRQAADSFESMSGKRVRHGRKLGSHAMEGVASSIDRLAAALTVESVGGTAASPEHKQAAIHVIEDDGDLSDNEQIQIFRVIRKDTAFADTLLSIHKKDDRTQFIKSELYPLLAGTNDF